MHLLAAAGPSSAARVHYRRHQARLPEAGRPPQQNLAGTGD